MISDIDKAYVAGLFDGEGNVRIYKHKGTRMTSPQYTVMACITNLNRGVLDFLRNKFGGDIQSRNRSNRWRTCYELRLSPGSAVPFFKAILPYLKIKNPQVKLALELHRLIETSLKPEGQGAKLPGFEVEAREHLYQKLKVLNKRGKGAISVGMHLKLDCHRVSNQLLLF